MGSSGLEPPTSRLSGARSNHLSYEPLCLSRGGDDGIRTHDPLLAGQVLSQLSYTPSSDRVFFSGSVLPNAPCVGSILSSRDVSIQVLSALRSLTTVFGMGTGGPCALSEPTSEDPLLPDPLPVIQNNKIEHLKLRLRNSASASFRLLLRKEVIQPHLPIRLPCYDLTPIIEPTFGRALLAVRLRTSGVPNFHGLTGGVYKARERIHRGMLIRDY